MLRTQFTVDRWISSAQWIISSAASQIISRNAEKATQIKWIYEAFLPQFFLTLTSIGGDEVEMLLLEFWRLLDEIRKSGGSTSFCEWVDSSSCLSCIHLLSVAFSVSLSSLVTLQRLEEYWRRQENRKVERKKEEESHTFLYLRLPLRLLTYWPKGKTENLNGVKVEWMMCSRIRCISVYGGEIRTAPKIYYDSEHPKPEKMVIFWPLRRSLALPFHFLDGIINWNPNMGRPTRRHIDHANFINNHPVDSSRWTS